MADGSARVPREVVDVLAQRLRALEEGTATRDVVVRVAACEVCGHISPHSGPLCQRCRARMVSERWLSGEEDGEPADDLTLAALVASVPGAVYRSAVDARRTIRYVSERITDITGYAQADFESGKRSMATIAHPDDRVPAAHRIAMAIATGSPFEVEYRILHSHGGVRWVSERGRATRMGRRSDPAIVGVVVDIDEDRTRRDQLTRLAFHDPLTGLANRRALDGSLEKEVGRRISAGTALSVAVIDVDLFKRVNDTHGHDVGDRVLVGVAERLRGCTRESELMARAGGEEFVWTMPGAGLPAATAAAERARRAVAAAPVGGIQGVTVSVGVACLESGEDAAGLLRRADTALYAAKAAGRNRVAVAPSHG